MTHLAQLIVAETELDQTRTEPDAEKSQFIVIELQLVQLQQLMRLEVIQRVVREISIFQLRQLVEEILCQLPQLIVAGVE